MEEKKLYTVREVCKDFSITRKTLFYYDRVGLVRPAERTGPQQHKLYGEREIEDLKAVIEYRNSGLKIEEIRYLMSNELSADDELRFLRKIRERLLKEVELRKEQIKRLSARIMRLITKEESNG